MKEKDTIMMWKSVVLLDWRAEKDKAAKVLGILHETPFCLFECPSGLRLDSLKALKTPHRTHAWL